MGLSRVRVTRSEIPLRAPVRSITNCKPPYRWFYFNCDGTLTCSVDTLIPYELFECFEFTRDGFFIFFRVKFGNAASDISAGSIWKTFEHCMQFFSEEHSISAYSRVSWADEKHLWRALRLYTSGYHISLWCVLYSLLKEGSRIQKYLHHRRESLYGSLFLREIWFIVLFLGHFIVIYGMVSTVRRRIFEPFINPLAKKSRISMRISLSGISREVFPRDRRHDFCSFGREYIHFSAEKNDSHQKYNPPHHTLFLVICPFFFRVFLIFFISKYLCLDFHDSKR